MNLEGVEVGDRVWGVLYGYGTVKGIDKSDFPIGVAFDGGDSSEFTSEGREYSEEKEPSLFFEMPKMYKNKEYPKKPRWRANTGESYFFINVTGKFCEFLDDRESIDNKLFSVGNYFKSEKMAKESELYKAFHKYDKENEGE